MTAGTLGRRGFAPAGSAGRGFGPQLRRLLAEIVRRIDERRRYRRTVRELMSLTDQELDDIGISRWQIPEIARDSARRSR